MLDKEFLRRVSFEKGDPEFANEIRGMAAASAHAQKMVKAGRMSLAEANDLESFLINKFIGLLPFEEYQEMKEDGRLEYLEKMASHDGTRSHRDVDQDRQGVFNRVKGDFLDDGWLNQKINSETYAKEIRSAAQDHWDDELSDLFTNGDFDGVAAEIFARRCGEPRATESMEDYVKSSQKTMDEPPEDEVGSYIHQRTKEIADAEARDKKWKTRHPMAVVR